MGASMKNKIRRRRAIEAERLFNSPWAIKRSALAALIANHKMLGDDEDDFDEDEDEKYSLMAGSIAVIPIKGALTKNSYWGTTCYSAIAGMCGAALQDPSVRALLLYVDSPGGEVSGMFNTADFLSSLRGRVPIAAIVDDSCYSAAFALASAADRIFVTRTGGTGSIGVFAAHVDYSKLLENEGVAVTYVYSGDKKIEGNSTQPLSNSARGEMQREVDRLRGMFAGLVARNRGVSEESILGTEAGVFMAGDGVPLLADEVGSVDDALDYLRERIETEGARGARIGIGSSHSWPVAGRVDRRDSSLQSLYQAAIGDGKPGWADQNFTAEQSFQIIGRKQPATLAVRSFPSLRAQVSGQSTDRKISLLVAPFGPSANLGAFKEVYERGCFSQGFDRDPRILFSHDERFVLGRTSAGTCEFWEEPDGVHASCQAPSTGWANDLLVSMRRGDITQASASFWILQSRWEMRGSDRVRVIEKAVMREASVHAFPAYELTAAVANGNDSLSAAATDLERGRRSLARLQAGLSPEPLTGLARARIRLRSLEN
jgi:capsid assembly protease